MTKAKKISVPGQVDPLTALAIRYGTDKFGYHDYTPNYWQLLCDWRDRPVKMLEIGVGGYAEEDRGGESLAVWRDFFPNGQITGFDIQKKTMVLGPRVTILQGSQIDSVFLADLVKNHGPFDIILDDGSHRNEHVIATFELLFPSLNMGGIYIVEDTQTAFHPRFGGTLERTAPNSVAYFAELFAQIDHVEMNAFLDTGIHPIARSIRSMQRFHNIVAIHKEDNTYPSNFRFDYGHPRVVETMQIFADVIKDDASESGLLSYHKLLTRAPQPNEAAQIIERLIAMKATTRAFFGLAIGHRLAQERLLEAEELARSALVSYPFDPTLLVKLSLVQQRQGNLPAAVDTAVQAAALAPRELTVQTRLTQILIAAGRFEEALVAVNRAIALRNKRGVSYYLKGRILVSLGQKDDAITALNEALVHDPLLERARDLITTLETRTYVNLPVEEVEAVAAERMQNAGQAEDWPV